MEQLVRPIKLSGLKKAKSKAIIDAFLSQPEPVVEILTESTGRDPQNVYVSLKLWLKRNPSVNVELRYDEKRLILSRVEPDDDVNKGDSSTVH